MAAATRSPTAPRGRLAGLLALALVAAAVGRAAAQAQQPARATGTGKRVLALVGSDAIKASHSQFLGALKAAGLAVEVKGVKDDELKLNDFDAWHYDSLVLLAPKASGFGGDVTKSAILDFVDAGGNLLVALAPSASDTMRSLAAEVGVEADAKGTVVYDHFSRQAAGGAADATLVATSAWADSAAVFGAARPAAPVLFRGVAQAVPSGSELVTVALSGEATTYSHDPKKAPAEPPALPAGAAAALVSLVQARNNARVMVAGSLDMFSDEAFDAKVKLAASGESFAKSGNKDFCVATALWTLQQRGVLEVSPPRHRKAATGEADPLLYRVNDDVAFEIDIFEVNGGERKPYSGNDVQVSFVMLDPYVRQPLKGRGNGTFGLEFKVPDVYGVFKYVIDYQRAGYSYIYLQKVVPVRPFKHDEYERFLLPAYPYYASAASTMAAFFIAGLVYLYSGAK